MPDSKPCNFGFDNSYFSFSILARFSFAQACSFSTPLMFAVTAAASHVAVAGALYFKSVKMLDVGPSSLWQCWIRA